MLEPEHEAPPARSEAGVLGGGDVEPVLEVAMQVPDAALLVGEGDAGEARLVQATLGGLSRVTMRVLSTGRAVNFTGR